MLILPSYVRYINIRYLHTDYEMKNFQMICPTLDELITINISGFKSEHLLQLQTLLDHTTSTSNQYFPRILNLRVLTFKCERDDQKSSSTKKDHLVISG